MNDKWLRDRLAAHPLSEDVQVAEDDQEPSETDPNNDEVETPINNSLDSSIESVMVAYQNANKWLDSIKEFLLMDLGCVFFSNYVHELAHRMPDKFDKFGDILHSANIKVPYPATEAIPSIPSDISTTFDQIFDILSSIRKSLLEFNSSVADSEYNFLSLSVDELILDIGSEYSNLYRMQKVCNSCDMIAFDKWVAQYLNNLDKLID